MSDSGKDPEPSMEEILASIRRILAEDEGSPSGARADTTTDVLELTEAIADDGSVRHIAPAGTPSSGAAADGRQEPSPPRSAGSVTADRLVSEATSTLAAATLARLADAPAEPRRAGAERSLEDVVRDMLRPMLQDWLDQNLPALVERLVRAEIARIAGDPRRP